MRKTFVMFSLIAGLGVAAPACNSAWWQQITSNPVESVQEFEAAIGIAVSAAQLAWPAILPAIPAANQAAANTQFMNALASVNHAEQLLNDGVNAAVAAETSNPNFTALMQAVSDAVSQVTAIIDLYSGTTVTTADAGPVLSLAMKAPTAAANVGDLHAAYKSLSRWGVKVK